MSAAAGTGTGTNVGRVRFTIVAMLFVVTMVNYADRAVLGLTGSALRETLGITTVQMGWVLSAFSWTYVAFQIPGGWLLDRFGSKMVYFLSIFLWSLFTFVQGGVSLLGATAAFYVLIILRLVVGLAESPSFPANARLVAAWFPAKERGTASAIFNSAQYFATVAFAGIIGWLTQTVGWPYAFYFMGIVGIIVSFIWLRVIYSPKQHPRLSAKELDYIQRGGALVHMDQSKPNTPATGGRSDDRGTAPTWSLLPQLLKNRMMLGIFFGQFCINALTVFFLTWFPIYLKEARGMSIMQVGFIAALPAVCGFFGGVLGGVWSDLLLKWGRSITAARKIPIVVGMLVSMSIVLCNFTDSQWLVVVFMAMAFFGKGVGALGWAVVSDTVPREIAGLAGGLFNTCGNISSITTPIIIGYLVSWIGWEAALVFVAANALLAILSYVVIVGEIKRVELRPVTTNA